MRVLLMRSSCCCDSNSLFASRWKRYLEENGHTLVHDVGEADWIVLAGCAFNKENEDQVTSYIQLAKQQLADHQRALVTGCYPGIVGTGTNIAVPDQIVFAGLGAEGEFDKLFGDRPRFADVQVTRMEPAYYSAANTGGSRADSFISIASGCVYGCSYCYIKKAKGYVKSVPVASILAQVRAEAERGARRFGLVADDSGSYGADIGESIVTLARALLTIPAPVTFELQYLHPGAFLEREKDLTELFSSGRFLRVNIPVQSTSQRLLKLMNRHYDAEAVLAAVARLKRSVSGLQCATHLMLCFPTETHEEAAKSLSDATKTFDETVALFYRHRSGVKASNLQPLPESEYRARAAYVQALVESLRPADAVKEGANPRLIAEFDVGDLEDGSLHSGGTGERLYRRGQLLWTRESHNALAQDQAKLALVTVTNGPEGPCERIRAYLVDAAPLLRPEFKDIGRVEADIVDDGGFYLRFVTDVASDPVVYEFATRSCGIAGFAGTENFVAFFKGERDPYGPSERGVVAALLRVLEEALCGVPLSRGRS